MVELAVDLDRHAIADLVRLKGALDHATRLAEDRSEWGRHVALVSLDGVVEYAMRLAVLHCEVRVAGRDGYHDVLSKLSECLGAAWRPQRRAILQVHDARNQAQHGAATPDPALMDGWADQVGGFVESLVVAAFGVALDDVMLADAVEDERLRAQVAAAESAIRANEPALGFATAYDAFVSARTRWHEQQQDAYGTWPPPSAFEADPRHVEPGERSADYADVGVFTSDLGEYHWLIATRRLVGEGVPATIEDARRALQFAYHWILRWQQFDARYPRERWRQYYRSLAPPVSGDGPPRIEWVRVDGAQMLGHRDLNKVVVQLANLPERGRDDWGIDMDLALRRAAQDVGAADVTLTVGPRTLTGQLTFLADRSLEAKRVAQCLRLAVDEATRLYRARREQTEQRAREADVIAADFAKVFAGYDGFFAGVETSRQVGPLGETVQLAIEYTGSPHELHQIAGILRSRGGRLASTAYGEGRLLVEAFPLDGDDRAKLEEALAASVDQVVHQRDFADKREHERLELERQLQAVLGAPETAPESPEG
jgi:hypothetical protein